MVFKMRTQIYLTYHKPNAACIFYQKLILHGQ